jgi:hypothetical protein
MFGSSNAAAASVNPPPRGCRPTESTATENQLPQAILQTDHCAPVLYQGTTSVVPKMRQKGIRALQAAEKLIGAAILNAL